MLPTVAFAWQSATLYDAFFDKHWHNLKYADYGTWDILESELYDYIGG